ncbi:hypothetical protein Vadar_034148 [Vaccinium darrowii]|uniref:Uncharacterized protein n=1 Tax=Vaccinium darrowii TaxID=229202 RepID=A0ACB7Y4C2_9ERIC|nr:hypothetical protein Vadar_034148 [Vaccinium darrowii]
MNRVLLSLTTALRHHSSAACNIVEVAAAVDRVGFELLHVHVSAEEVVFRSDLVEATRRRVEGVRDEIQVVWESETYVRVGPMVVGRPGRPERQR